MYNRSGQAGLFQAGQHLLFGTYLAYLAQIKAAPLLILIVPWDRGVRQAARNWLGDVVRHPGRLFDGLRVQTLGIIQAPDVQPNGQADMCDSCPDMTVWNGTLINSCRMDEYWLFGDLISVAEKREAEAQPEPMVLSWEAELEKRSVAVHELADQACTSGCCH